MDASLNYWKPEEYSKNKLLLHSEKVQSILSVLTMKSTCDYTYPLSVDLHLTNQCNLKCEWCIDRDINYRHDQMSKGTAIKLVKEFAKMGTGITIEGGGEPTVYPYFAEVVKAGKKYNANMGLITNGVKNISEQINSFKWVRISLDSSCREEYLQEKGVDCFDKVMENIESYKEKRNKKSTYLGIGYVLTKRNYSHIEELISRLNDSFVDYMYIRPVEGYPEIRPSIDELEELEKKLNNITKNYRIKVIVVKEGRYEINNGCLPCVAHSLTSIIHANGDVVCCEKRKHDIHIMGNVEEHSFAEIWNSKEREEISKSFLNPNSQMGCDVCRLTSFNHMFTDICDLNTANFI